MADKEFRHQYKVVKDQCAEDLKGSRSGEAIIKLAVLAVTFLREECELVELTSQVEGKTYCTYRRGMVFARPANREMFLDDAGQVEKLWYRWLEGKIKEAEFVRLSYTVALAPCLVMELFDRQNKKGPATFFECYIGHMFARELKANAFKEATFDLPTGQSVAMTMDFLFDIGGDHRKIHVPVKMSTRERVVQAWAHHRMLDAAFGVGAFRGIMVLFAETKLSSKSHEVIEICVPDQWLAYQTLLSRMDRIYYFDVPARYAALTEKFPKVIQIKQVSEFFRERDAVLSS